MSEEVKENRVVAVLSELGWRAGKDEVGDRFCVLKLDDRQILVLPTVRKASDHLRVTLMPSISTEGFTSAISYIREDSQGGHEPLIVSREPVTKLPNLTREDVVRLSESAISWAKAQDIEQGLSAYRGLPTDSKGAMPLRHLAALALAKDVPRLESYQRAFEQGDRLGFVPYIQKEMIDRAVSLARSE